MKTRNCSPHKGPIRVHATEAQRARLVRIATVFGGSVLRTTARLHCSEGTYEAVLHRGRVKPSTLARLDESMSRLEAELGLEVAA